MQLSSNKSHTHTQVQHIHLPMWLSTAPCST